MRGRDGENKIREQKEGGDHFCHGEARLLTNRLLRSFICNRCAIIKTHYLSNATFLLYLV